MKKPLLPSSMPIAPQPAAFVPADSVAGHPQPTRLTHHDTPPVAAYVDPYLFEVGYYANRAEYEQLTRTAPIRSRAEAEATPTRRKPRARKSE